MAAISRMAWQLVGIADAEPPGGGNSRQRAPEPRGPWRNRGCLKGLRVQLTDGLYAPRMKPTSPPTTAAPYHKFHPWRVGSSGGELTGNAKPAFAGMEIQEYQ